jgi:hypothetical protein
MFQPLRSVLFLTTFISIARKCGQEDRSPEEPSLKIQRTNYYPSEAPPRVAQPAVFQTQVQLIPDIQMFSNRPCSATSTPITLLRPIFGEFDDDSKRSQENPKISSSVPELAEEICKFYGQAFAKVS